ncbi:MAG: FecR domain-containing protein [Candidatus Thiodiazotropha sp.]
MHARKILKITWSAALLLWLMCGPVQAEDWTYRIREGENLTILAARYLKPEFTAALLQDYNGIVQDRKISIGTGIQIPIDWMKALLAAVRVSLVEGDAKLRHGDQDEWGALQVDTLLQAGDRILTGARSRVSVVFADGSSLQIGENSEVVFDALSAYQGKGMLDTQIHLQRGRLENQVVPRIHPKSRYEIHTPAAVTVVRGTAFRVMVAESSGETRTELSQGRLSVTAQGMTRDLSAGEGVRMMPGEPPGEPWMLLPKPDLDQMDISESGGDIQLDWPDLDKAVGYRIQLLDLQGTMLHESLSSESRGRLSTPGEDIYVLGIRGIDAQGWEGLEGKRVLSLAGGSDGQVAETRPEHPSDSQPPMLYAPQVTPRGVLFRWTGTPGAWAYRLRMTRDAEGREVLFEQLGFGLGFEMAGPLPAPGYVRIEALMEDSDTPLSSATVPLPSPLWYRGFPPVESR